MAWGQGGDAPTITLRVKEGKKLAISLSTKQDSTALWIDGGDGKTERILVGKEPYEVELTTRGRQFRVLGNTAGFDCNGNAEVLLGIDISQCPTLEELNCSECGLGQIDVTGNPLLTTLECAGNRIIKLDLSASEKLEWLDCHANRLSQLDATKCTALQILDCSQNALLNLDVSQNKKLEKLYCQGNQLASLDVHENPNISLVSCYNNNLSAMSIEEMLRGLHVVGRQGGELFINRIREHAPHSLRSALDLAERKRWVVHMK